MSQISPPIRIVLVAAIGLIAAWMLFLRPKADPVPAPTTPVTAPGVKGLTNAVDKAKEAKATQEASDAKVQSATGEEAASGAKSGSKAAGSKAAKGAAVPAVPAADLATVPKNVRSAIADHKVLVLLFWNPKSADDRATRKAVLAADRWDGEAVVRVADVKDVSKYGTITRGAEVAQSPSIVVVDRKLKVERLDGYESTRTVDQAVLDAMRNSGVVLKDPYLRKINAQCATAGLQLLAIPDAQKPSEISPTLSRTNKVWKRFMTRFAATPAPAKWRSFKRAAVKDGNAMAANNAAWLRKLGKKPSLSESVASFASYAPSARKLGKSWNTRMDKQHVLSCGAQT